jgi:putative ABC transport system permease protein
MYNIYLKQTWKMLKEDKVISIITIFGTALAITMIMVVILTQEIKTTNIAPEVNREKTMFIKWEKKTRKDINSTSLNIISGKSYKQYLSQLKTPELISLQNRSLDRIYSTTDDEYLKTDIMFTDPEFWEIYRLSFLEGKPFSKEHFQSGLPTAVICKSLAQKLFKGESALGKEFSYNDKTYRINGIVKDVSTLCNNAYSQIWIPYTSRYESVDNGYFTVTILAKNKKDFRKIKQEVRESEIRNNTEPDKSSIDFIGPYSLKELLMKESNFTNEDPNSTRANLKFFLILSVLLLIPAINLSGFSLFKIINRTSEIGIRKAFGANKKTILMQVFYENLLTSIIGGVIGLILSYGAIILIKDRLFTDNSFGGQFLGENTIPISAFISPSVFFYVFMICILLNLLAAGIPAWKASRLNIVNAINS